MRLTPARDPREKASMRGVFKSAAVHLALAAMVLRALLPVGWMPNTAHAGAGPLMLCDGMEPAMHDMPAMADMPGMSHDAMASMPGMDHEAPPPSDHPQHHGAGAPCVFAAAAPLATPVAALPVPAPAPHAIALAFTPAQESDLSRRAYRPNAARAPPASA